MDLIAPGTIEAFGLYLVRTSVLILGSPFFGAGNGFGGYKIAMIVSLSVILYSVTGVPLGEDLDPILFAGLALREVLVGAFLAFIFQLTLLGVQIAGHLIGHEMAFNMARSVDPNSGAQMPVLASMYETLFLLALISVDGHHWVLRALSESFERAPVGAMDFSASVSNVVITFFTQIFGAGLTFAAPIMVLLTLVSVMIALLTRAVPHLNIMEFGFSLRITGGMASVFIFTPSLTPALTRMLNILMDGLEAGLVALEG
ncbi:MAG: flagellar biosynthetic protein FliR [Planctomycetota bacterium]|jgi:flagellar biosynthetic protein FliR